MTSPAIENEYNRVRDAAPPPSVRITAVNVRANTIASQLAELWRYRNLIWLFAARNLRLRYKGSVLGIFWSMILPIVQVAVLTVVFGYFMRLGPSNFSAFVLCAFLPWIFFSSALPDGASSVLGNLDLLKKVYLPREVLPIASIVANFVHFCAALFIFIVYRYVFTTIVFSHFGPHGFVSGWPGLPPATIFMLPLVVIDLVMLTGGLVFFVAAITTFAEDFKYIVQASLSIMFYALPIIYFSENIFYAGGVKPSHKHELMYKAYLLDPLAWIITAFKQMFFAIQPVSNRGAAHVIYSAPFNYRLYGVTTIVSFVVLCLGYIYFNRVKWRFTERP